MKQFLYILSLAFTALMLGSCSADDDAPVGLDSNYKTYGTVIFGQQQESNYSILTDDMKLLRVRSNTVASIPVTDGQRVTAIFNLLSESSDNSGYTTYDIKLIGIFPITTKEPVKQSFLGTKDTQIREDSLGYDLISVEGSENIWIAGKYLNVQFRVYTLNDPSVTHFVNLVHDDMQERADTVFTTLRHNNYGLFEHNPNYTKEFYKINESIISFDASTLIPEGQEDIVIKIKWYDYGSPDFLEPVERSRNITFSLDPSRLTDNVQRPPSQGYVPDFDSDVFSTSVK